MGVFMSRGDRPTDRPIGFYVNITRSAGLGVTSRKQGMRQQQYWELLFLNYMILRALTAWKVRMSIAS